MKALLSAQEPIRALAQRLSSQGIEGLRVSWADVHGSFRGKTLVADEVALHEACTTGLGFVSTIVLKDSSDRTAFRVFDRGAEALLPGLPAGAGNLLMRADPASFVALPWAPRTGWLRGELWLPDGSPVEADPRRVLQRALLQLRQQGLELRCGLEVEFHVYRIVDDGLAPEQAAWPAEPPLVRLVHPGYQLLSEAFADQADEVLALVRRTALGLGLPLRSLEIELGPSQFEAVFAPTEALTAADQMLLFRNGVRQALRRAGYHASFVCRPPLPAAVASGWHLHHSLVSLQGENAFCCSHPEGTPNDARRWLSATGSHWLAGLLAHAPGLAAICAPTIPAYARYQGSVMAPQAARWGRDNRGAMLRVIGAPGDKATRIENRLSEPMANPYLVIAAHVFAGLDGVHRRLDPGPATETPYVPADEAALPATLGDALDALADDAVLQHGLGPAMTATYDTLKRHELARHAAAPDPAVWERREYFGRF